MDLWVINPVCYSFLSKFYLLIMQYLFSYLRQIIGFWLLFLFQVNYGEHSKAARCCCLIFVGQLNAQWMDWYVLWHVVRQQMVWLSKVSSTVLKGVEMFLNEKGWRNRHQLGIRKCLFQHMVNAFSSSCKTIYEQRLLLL